MLIIATISKNSYAPAKIEEIITAGATILRFNFSHGSPAEMEEHIKVAREVITRLKRSDVKILADLPGAKLRLGRFEPSEFLVKAGQEVIFKSASGSVLPQEFIPVNAPEIGLLVQENQEISVGEGDPSFLVKKIIGPDSFQAISLNDGFVQTMKGFNVGIGVDELNHITADTLAHIKILPNIKPDLIAVSFVNSAKHLEEVRRLIKASFGSDQIPPLVAKVETIQGVEKIEEIAASVDWLMVARGDLALTAPYELLGVYQKRIIIAAKKAGKPVIVATQILESLLDKRRPTRSEILDLTNIVLDGADAIMFAKETGLSLTPGFSVKIAQDIINAVEKNKNL
jgi:pyruvate kinase